MVYRMVFTVDGACRGNGTRAARGAAACCLHLRWGRMKCKTALLPWYPYAPTNQRAELCAIILALKWARERFEELRGYPYMKVIIRTDSRYAVGCLTEWIYNWLDNGWTNARGFEVTNRDLIQRAWNLMCEIENLPGHVVIEWIPRSENTAADEMASDALDDGSEDSY